MTHRGAEAWSQCGCGGACADHLYGHCSAGVSLLRPFRPAFCWFRYGGPFPFRASHRIELSDTVHAEQCNHSGHGADWRSRPRAKAHKGACRCRHGGGRDVRSPPASAAKIQHYELRAQMACARLTPQCCPPPVQEAVTKLMVCVCTVCCLDLCTSSPEGPATSPVSARRRVSEYLWPKVSWRGVCLSQAVLLRRLFLEAVPVFAMGKELQSMWV